MSDDGPGCPDIEQLAQYVDGTLPGAQRQAVEVHLADCDACRELAAEIACVVSADTGEPGVAGSASAAPVAPVAPAPARVLPFRSPRLGIAAALTAAAAVIVAVRVQPAWLGFDGGAGSRWVALQAAVAAARPTPGRFTGFDHAVYRAPSRGVPAQGPEDLALLAAARAAEDAVERDPSVSNRHAWGVAQVLIRDWNGAVRTLESLSRERPTDARVLNDLAAAYVARGEALGQPEDFQEAIARSAKALQADPALVEPLFNAALAREALGEREPAIEAWRRVLDRDTSTWRQEAQRRVDALTQTAPPTP